MTLQSHSGGCHCGNIRLEFQSPRSPAEFKPRSCDCSFCSKHGAAYVSDPGGKLNIETHDRQELTAYRHGSASADFLLCRKCGVLIAAIYSEDGRRYATVNVNALEDRGEFGPASPASPWKLEPVERRALWKKLWIAEVSIA